MWQIQWMLALIPDSLLVWIYSFILATGIVFYFGGFLCKYWPFKMIPLIGQFPILGKLVGGLLVVLGIFLFGGYVNEMSWRDKVHQLEEKIKESEKKSADANKKLDAAIKEKNAQVKNNLNQLRGQIRRDAAKIDAECKVPREAVEILNKAAETPKRNKQ
jgi:hypothetical protein